MLCKSDKPSIIIIIFFFRPARLYGKKTSFFYEGTRAYATALWHLMHYYMRDVKDMGQQMGYRSL